MEVAVVTDTVLCIHANKNITSSISHVEKSEKVTIISKAIRKSLDLFLYITQQRLYCLSSLF